MALYNPKLQPSALFRVATTETPPKGRVLFVHGAWHGAWFWQRWQEAFAERGYDTYAVDLYGHGTRRQDGWIWRAGIDDYLTCVREAIAEIGTCILVGHSMGGFTVMKLLETYHEAPAAVLLAPVPHTGEPLKAVPLLTKLDPLAALALTFSLPVRLRRETAVRQLFFSDDIDDATVRLAMRELGPETAKACMQLLFTKRVKPELIATKTLVAQAEQDALIPYDALQTLATRLPQGELQRLPGAAHDVALDTRWQDHARIVCDWLDRVNARTPVPDLSPPPNWKHAKVEHLIARPDGDLHVALPPTPGMDRAMIHRPEPKA